MFIEANNNRAFSRSYNYYNNQEVFQEAGDLKDDGFNEAVARAKAPKRPLDVDSDPERRLDADSDPKTKKVKEVSERARLKRHRDKEQESGMKKVKTKGKNIEKLPHAGQKRHLENNQDLYNKKAKVTVDDLADQFEAGVRIDDGVCNAKYNILAAFIICLWQSKFSEINAGKDNINLL